MVLNRGCDDGDDGDPLRNTFMSFLPDGSSTALPYPPPPNIVLYQGS